MNEPTPPEELSNSYQSILQSHDWLLDEPDALARAKVSDPSSDQGAIPTADRRPLPTTHRSLPTAHCPLTPTAIIEALLFVGGRPLTTSAARDAIRGLDDASFQEGIDDLNQKYRVQGRPYAIEKKADGYILQLKTRFRNVIKDLFGGVREARLTQPAVDVLAIVAYRQPVTRQEIETVRGHESGSIIRQLVRRSLIAVVSRAESGGREVQYGTTGRFLELFGLTSLDDLPQTEDLQRL